MIANSKYLKATLNRSITSTMSAFRYQPLDYASSEIRLVKLGRAENDHDPIKIDLFHAFLDDHPSYKALSYTWGAPFEVGLEDLSAWNDPKETRFILINDQEFPARRSLEAAIRCLRPQLNAQEDDSPFWIDAICIDQSSNVERNHQVRRMKDIYKTAKEVVAWLGPEANGSGLAMARFQAVFDQIISENEDIFGFVGRPLSQQYTNLFAEEDKVVEPSLAIAMCWLFQRSWWKRSWIVQEATVNPHTSIICGAYSVNIDAVVFSMYFLMDLLVVSSSAITSSSANPQLEVDGGYQLNVNISLEELALMAALSTTIKLAEVRLRMHGWCRGISQNVQIDLLSLLSTFHDWRATDPRDKVYALSRLLPAPESRKIIPDYSLSFQKVYGQVVQYCVESLGTLDIFGYCSLQQNLENELPSWVPDWRAMNKPHEADMAIPLHTQSLQQGEAPYQASGASQPVLHFSEGFTTLRIEGLQIDTLKNVRALDASYLDQPPAAHGSEESHREPGSLRNTDAGATVSVSLQPEDVAFLNERAQSIGSSESYTFQQKQFDKSLMSLFPSTHSADPTEAWDRIRKLVSVGTSRKLVTSERFVGLGPKGAQVGDVVCIFFGGRNPYLLRRSSGDSYLLVGECYFNGLMHGEALSGIEEWNFQKKEFTLH
jgi:hypothetical protein